MQTFLPSQFFEQSAKWLDNQRLGKQRVECLQILKALADPDYGWQNHPAVKMWRGYSEALFAYSMEICDEWIWRGKEDTCKGKIIDVCENLDIELGTPSWLTDEFCSTHRAILLGKAWEKVNELEHKMETLQFERDHLVIGSVEEVETTKQINALYRQLQKAYVIQDWYQSFGWQEEPAQRNAEGKWPYLWPETV